MYVALFSIWKYDVETQLLTRGVLVVVSCVFDTCVVSILLWWLTAARLCHVWIISISDWICSAHTRLHLSVILIRQKQIHWHFYQRFNISSGNYQIQSRTKFDLVFIMLPLWTISNLQINQELLSAILFKARVNGWRAMPPPNYKEISGATQWLPSWTELEQATHSWVYVNEERQHKISQISESGRVRNLKAHASLLLFEICDKRI